MFKLLVSLVTILVSSQQDYDAMPARLRTALDKQPEEVRVVFKPGVYHFQDDHLHLWGLRCPGTRLSFEGNGAVLRGTAPTIHAGPFTQMDKYVEGVDPENKKCRVRTGQRLDGPGKLYIQITSWYRTFTGPVTGIQDGYIYFTLDELKKNGFIYNVNSDLTYGWRRPRFRLLRVQEADGPVSTPVFHFTDCDFRSLSLSGFVIERNTGGRTEYGKNCAVRFYKNRFGEASVSGCTFRNLQSDAVHVIYTDGVDIKECRFEDCYRRGVMSYNHSGRTRVLDCSFERMDLALENSPCVQCEGTDYRISGNRFVDYGNTAIRVGVHFIEEMKWPSSGVVEKNEIWQSDAYRAAAPMNLLMDTGAIYVTTQNTSLEICGNYVHDISGAYDNKGIFCDDGTVNTYIHDNVVLRIVNSYCIDLRRERSVENRQDSKIKVVNVGNRLGTNQVDGKVRFQER